jgi:PKHD-type hydroxylase
MSGIMKTNLIYQNQFSDAECDWIINESERVLDVKNAVIGEEGDNESLYRKSQTGFIHYNTPEHNELWNVVSSKLWNVVNDANRTNFGFDISYLDSVQYTVYHDGGDHYDWHIDTFLDTPNAFHRKLSVTVQLTNSNEYTGGDFKLRDGTGQELPEHVKDKGSVLIFPSFLLHKVTPVTSGTRRTLVAWFEGKRFK